MKISILSGKGGTGKSMITSSLVFEISKSKKVVLVDTDADCPNQHLLFKGELVQKIPIQASKVAILDKGKCSLSKKCIDVCEFGAIEERNGKIEINAMKCEGCGACTYVCPNSAIKMIPKVNGHLIHIETERFPLVYGKLLPGESASGKVVFYAKKKAEEISKKVNSEITIIDSAAGIGCPVIASVTGCDYVIGIAEPTPTGIRNLERALEVVEFFKIPYFIVMNKVGISEKNEEIIREKFKDKIIGEIPYDKQIPVLIADGRIPINAECSAKNPLKELFNALNGKLGLI